MRPLLSRSRVSFGCADTNAAVSLLLFVLQVMSPLAAGGRKGVFGQLRHPSSAPTTPNGKGNGDLAPGGLLGMNPSSLLGMPACDMQCVQPVVEKPAQPPRLYSQVSLCSVASELAWEHVVKFMRHGFGSPNHPDNLAVLCPPLAWHAHEGLQNGIIPSRFLFSAVYQQQQHTFPEQTMTPHLA